VSAASVAATAATAGAARKRARRSSGTRILAGILKVVAVLIWIGAVAALVLLGGDILSGPRLAFVDTFSAFLHDSAAIAALAGLVVGFLLFGIAEVIGLLDDIRRNLGLHRP
jgi:hypothetical protein